MKPNYFLIANAHLDPVWQWCFPEGLSLVKSTFRSALDRMKEFPDYTFTSACAGYYKWIWLSEPEMFEEIKERVREGRWCVAGGMWVQPDCNLPSGESFCRHTLYSQQFFREHFGRIARTGYNVDSFGHNGMLPQILLKSGMENYVYQRPDNRKEKPGLPAQPLHDWQSPDGSLVHAFRIPDSYCGDIDEQRFEEHYYGQEQPVMVFFGIGNHGGGPSKEQLKKAGERIAAGNFQYATPDSYFAQVTGVDRPLVQEDLQHHASGCYSANSRIKQLNRRAEAELVAAEKLDVLAGLLTGSALHKSAIESAWERVMFNQFHDILAGCSIKEAYTDAENAFGYARETALGVNTFAAQRVSWRIKTTDILEGKDSEMRNRLWYRDGEGSPLVVFNPHSFPVRAVAQFGTEPITKVLDSRGNSVPFQMVRASYTDCIYSYKCIFEAEIPAYGYGVYYLYQQESEAAGPFATDLSCGEEYLENGQVRIEFDRDSGAVSSYVFKDTGTQFADGLLGRAVVCDDTPNDTWGHDVYEYNVDVGAFGGGTLELVETGPVRATVKSVTTYGNSTLTRYYSLYNDSHRLTVRTVLDMDEPYKSVKLSFEAAVRNQTVTYSMPYGFIEKPANGQEEPSHAWCDLCEDSGKGLGLLNTAKYSFCAIGNDLRMMIARSCAYLDHYGQSKRDGEVEFLDKGEQEFTYEIFPHEKKANAALFRAAEVLNTPLQSHLETHHDGALPPVYSALSVDRENVVVTAVKGAQDGNGYVLRAVEVDGTATTATVTFGALGAAATLTWKPQEIKTLRIAPDGTVTECRIIEQ